MNRRIFCKSMLLSLLILVVAVGMAAAQATRVDANSYMQQFDNGQVNWQEGIITAVGIGAPPESAKNPAQARAMAQRAATVVARRNLLEITKGVQIDSTTTVEDFMVTSDIIQTQVNGFLRNSQVIDTAYMSDGAVEVTVALNIRGGFANVILPQAVASPPQVTPPAPPVPQPTLPTPPVTPPATPPIAPAPTTPSLPAAPIQVYTGLIVDARGLGAKPAMTPKVLDENGMEVYGSSFVSREFAIQQGMAGYAKDPAVASQNPRVAETPFVAKAIDAKGRARTDLVISNDQANQIRSLTQHQNFLEKCRVMVILD